MAKAAQDEELVEGLKQTKKSPRHFALIAKGAAPLKLLFSKRPLRDGELAKAKTEVKGNEIIVGVAIGSGADLALCVVAGEEPTIKPAKIKELIAERTGLTAKPRWELVATLPEVREAEEFSPPPPAAAPAAETAAGATEAAPAEAAASPAPPAGSATPAALDGWRAARNDAVAQLRQVGKEIAQANHPESARALIELKAVVANLTENPTTPQQVAELERYLTEDDVVLDVCELASDIRTPLLAALGELKATVAA